MPNDIFSLFDRHWIPVLRASGAPDTIRPADITSCIGDDPVVAIAWGRPDLDAATREFLIGLLATACGVDARDRLRAWFNNPPAPKALDAAFAPLAPAFILDGSGPRFQQDLDPLGEERVPVSQLFIEAPGDNTVRKNLDHFVHRGGIEPLSRAGATITLHCLQTFAPAGGAGNRVSLRGGGPLTTLLAPGTDQNAGPASPLWRTLWLNVLPAEGENDDPPPHLDLARIFPWLAPTRVSDKGLVTTPEDVDRLQSYWGMPRRIRLDFEPNVDKRACSLTGIVDDVIVRTYRRWPHGTSYAAWKHPLSPHYRVKGSSTEWLPLHGQPGRIGYRHWVGLVVADTESLREPAKAVVVAHKRLEHKNVPQSMRFGARLLASGYDMDNMKARDFIESEMPLHLVREELFQDYSHTVEAMVAGARDAAFILRVSVRQALFGDNAPGDGGKIADARERFWDRTEPMFGEILAPLAHKLETGDAASDPAIRKDACEQWLRQIRRTAENLFDELVPQTDFDIFDFKTLERRIEARRALRTALRGYGKFGQALFKSLHLRPPEPAKPGRKSDPVNPRAKSPRGKKATAA
jgi:CRISPR system Cascade subunit CasA